MRRCDAGGLKEREFAGFFERVEPNLRRALVATYGPADGRQAACDALSWAWENWERLRVVANKPGYLYRVGQSSARRYSVKAPPAMLPVTIPDDLPEVTPELMPALARLSEQQRTVVLLVHAFGWGQREVARMLEISPSSVREHLARALSHLRADLEVRDAV